MQNVCQESGESSLRMGQLFLLKLTDPNQEKIRVFVFYVFVIYFMSLSYFILNFRKFLALQVTYTHVLHSSVPELTS